MLTEICAYLRNWFDEDEFHNKLPRLEGSFTITEGVLPELAGFLQSGQLFWIYGSVFNDGVYQYTDELALKDETFKGTIQSMRTEPDFLAIVNEIDAWVKKYGGTDSAALSPFNSESFGGYSYSKSSGGSSEGGNSAAGSPLSVFRSRLNRWRKV